MAKNDTIFIGANGAGRVKSFKLILDELRVLSVDSRAMFTVGATDFLSNGGALVPLPTSIDSTLSACDDASDQALAFGTVISASGAVLPAAELPAPA